LKTKRWWPRLHRQCISLCSPEGWCYYFHSKAMWGHIVRRSVWVQIICNHRGLQNKN
jgi:hypothetical protein